MSLTGLRATWPPALEASPTRSTRWEVTYRPCEKFSPGCPRCAHCLSSRSRRPSSSTTSSSAPSWGSSPNSPAHPVARGVCQACAPTGPQPLWPLRPRSARHGIPDRSLTRTSSVHSSSGLIVETVRSDGPFSSSHAACTSCSLSWSRPLTIDSNPSCSNLTCLIVFSALLPRQPPCGNAHALCLLPAAHRPRAPLGP